MSIGPCLMPGAAALFALLAPRAALAHVFDDRYELPVPLELTLSAAGAVVASSFLLASLLLRPPRTGAGAEEVEASPRSIERGPVTRWLAAIVRGVAVAAWGLSLLACLIGSRAPMQNIGPVLVWVVAWVGLAFASAFVGDVWRVLNPWDAVARAAAWIARTRRHRPPHDYPAALGCWPATILLLAISWFLLGSGAATESRFLAAALLAYSVLTWTGMALFGRAVWLDRADALTQLWRVFAACAPIDVATLSLRWPGAGLIVARPLTPDRVILVVTVLSMASFEGFLDTAQWVALMDAFGRNETEAGVHAPVATAVGLIAFVLGLLTVFLAACALSRAALLRWGRLQSTDVPGISRLAGLFVISLVPIAVAYHVAHYLYWFTVSSQLVVPLVSDPFGWGWNLFGTRAYRPDIAPLRMQDLWTIILAAIVAGHVIAVGVAHKIALRVFASARAAFWSQLPLTLLMVAYTAFSLWILAQPVVV